jgi:hypothetical protein
MHQHDNGPQAAREKKQKLRRADTAAGFPSTLALFTPYLGLCPDKVVDSSFTNAMPSTSSSNHPELECLFTLAEQYCANHQAHHRDEHILCSEDSAYLDTVTGHELNLQRTSILVVGHYAEDQVIRFIRLAPHHLLMYLPSLFLVTRFSCPSRSRLMLTKRLCISPVLAIWIVTPISTFTFLSWLMVWLGPQLFSSETESSCFVK